MQRAREEKKVKMNNFNRLLKGREDRYPILVTRHLGGTMIKSPMFTPEGEKIWKAYVEGLQISEAT